MSKTSFWTAIFWCPIDLPELYAIDFCMTESRQDWGVDVYGRKETIERLAKKKIKRLNSEMLHPEDRLWRYKLIELKGGKR